MSIVVEPDDALEFDLSAPNDPTEQTLVLTNTSPDAPAVFKVKTTKPKRYLVRPNQGVVEPKDTASVSVVLLAQDKAQLIEDYRTSGVMDTSNKFLLQSTVLTPQHGLKLAEHDKNSKAHVAALSSLWGELKDQNEPTSQKKLAVRFKFKEELPLSGASRGAAAAAPLDDVKESLKELRQSTPAKGRDDDYKIASSANPKDKLWEEVKTLRKKYDDLVAFTVNLTAEKDLLQRNLDQTKEDLGRETNLRKQVEKTMMDSAGRNKGAGMTGVKSSTGSFTLIQVLLLAACFFCLGRYVSGNGAASAISGA